MLVWNIFVKKYIKAYSKKLAYSKTIDTGKKIKRAKERGFVSWHEDMLIGKAKAMQASKATQGFNSLFPIGRQMFSLFHESRAHHVFCRHHVYWKINAITPNAISSFFPPVIMLNMMSYGTEYPYGQFGSAVPPSFLFTSSLIASRATEEAENHLGMCKHCSATIKTWLCYHHRFHQKCKTQNQTTHKSMTNCGPDSFISVLGKVMEQFILDSISKQVEEKKGIRSSQHGPFKGKSH